ncbi:nitroreductase family protein [Miniphocaeibacter massiliensis]|uniref:nitroreductase family protein n=1 Tax=Miniphocaeibacter massiliensis TaxID=2041841 RepID=UPI000C1BC05D|nr:nitroreductase family protein [Miniphocaeibacter massiliensis]
MNEIISQINNRKSVRKYLEKNISDNIKRVILESAIQAPSAGNQQIYTIIDVENKKIKEKLSVLCDNQPFIKEAAMVLVFCSDYKKWYDLYKHGKCDPRSLGVGDFLLSVSDTVIAAQNTVVAAESFGIGSCYIGDILENYEDVKELLNIPRHVVPVTMIVYGYPTENQKNRSKPKRPSLDLIVHKDKYNELKNEKLEELVKHNLKTVGFEKWIKAFCKRKYNSEFSKEMNRSVEKYLGEFYDKSY